MIWMLQMWIPFGELSSDYPGKSELSMDNYVNYVNPFGGIIIYGQLWHGHFKCESQMWIPLGELSYMDNYDMDTSNVNPFGVIIIYGQLWHGHFKCESQMWIPLGELSYMDNYDMDTSNVNPKCKSLWGNYHIWTIMTWTLQMWMHCGDLSIGLT
jgi:G:T-mismatch repair DNA endonuclease (very short patch repair protein)